MPRRSRSSFSLQRPGASASPLAGRRAVLAAVASAAASLRCRAGRAATFSAPFDPSSRCFAWRRPPEARGAGAEGHLCFGRRGGDAHRRATRRRAVFTEFVGELKEGPAIFIGEVAAVVALSSLFEAVERSVRENMAASGDATGQKILNALFKEVTSLGYIGLFLFLATRSGAADVLVKEMNIGHAHAEGGAEGLNPLAETFEVVHIMIFMLLTVLLFQAAAVLSVSRQTIAVWDEYERSRAFGEAYDSLETRFVENGYIIRDEDPSKPRGIELTYGKPFTWGKSLAERLFLRQDPLVKLVMWRVIRHEFLFPRKFVSREGVVYDMPKPRFFSFQEYLGEKLGKSVLGLVEVETQSWLVTLLLLVPIVYYCITLDFVAVEGVQCGAAWLLCAFAFILVNQLEEETYQLTPTIPQDARQILRLLEGTNAAYAADEVVLSENVESALPGLAEVESTPIPQLSRPVAYTGEWGKEQWKLNALPTRFYERAFQIIAFWQACIVTSLIVTYLSEPLETPMETTLFALAWLEWPIMLFYVVPIFLRRFTMRNSIERKKDIRLIRDVSLKTKAGLLKDYLRLVQVFNLERRARENGEPWTVRGHKGWNQRQATEKFEQGLLRFRALPQNDKLDIWKIFAAWDVNNNETVCANEISETISTMKVPNSQMEHSGEVAESLIRYVDHDQSGVLTWRKFKALVMLATTDKRAEEVHADLTDFFSILDTNKDGEITIFELADWSMRGPIGMNRDEFATLLYKHFDKAKPSMTKDEFISWVQAL